MTMMKVMPSSRWIFFSSNHHLLAQAVVERAERLVEKQHGGLADQRTGERHALLPGRRSSPADSDRPARRGLTISASRVPAGRARPARCP